jgi:hypothetical protein
LLSALSSKCMQRVYTVITLTEISMLVTTIGILRALFQFE